jgi:uncharacterized membrane protein
MLGPLRRLSAESRLLLLLGLAFGLPAVVLVPPAITYDGPSHYFRALQVSEGTVRATAFSARAVGGVLPAGHAAFINGLWSAYWHQHDVGTLGEWAVRSRQAGAQREREPVEFTNTAVYSPLNYLFAALGMRVATWLSPSPLLASRLGCLANLLGYLALMVLALERIPRYRAGLLLLSTSPLLLIQAASLSTDAVNHALPALLIAWVWAVRVQAPARPRQDLAVIAALSLLLALLKPTALVTLACLPWLPTGLFGSLRAKAVFLGATILGALAVWYLWNRANLTVDVAGWFDGSRLPAAAQQEWFLGDPRHFGPPFLHLLRYNLLPQWPHLFADVGGWIPDRLYLFLDVLSFVYLTALLLAPGWEGRTDWSWAAAMVAQAAATVVLLALTLWLAFGKREVVFVPGVVGRYLTVVVLGLAIAVAELWHHRLGRLRQGLFGLGLLGNAAGLAAILGSIGSRVL